MSVSSSSVATKIETWDRIARPFFSFVRLEPISLCVCVCVYEYLFFCYTIMKCPGKNPSRSTQVKLPFISFWATQRRILNVGLPRRPSAPGSGSRKCCGVHQKRFLPSECDPLPHTTSSGGMARDVSFVLVFF